MEENSRRATWHAVDVLCTEQINITWLYRQMYWLKELPGAKLWFSPHRFLRERRARSKSLVSRATQTIVSAWAPAAAARIRARSCADRWAPPPCSRCGARRRRRRGSSVPWKRAKGRAWSPATSASPHSSCVCSRASPSSSPACYNTSSWSEGIFNYRIERESKKITESMKEPNEIKNKHLRYTSKTMYVLFLFFFLIVKVSILAFSSPCSCCLLPSLSSVSFLSLSLCCLCITVCVIC